MIRPSKIVCVGRNYDAHAREMGQSAPAEPLIFLKPPSALIGSGDPIRLPAGVGRVDFEGEIALILGRTARHVSADEAWDLVCGVAPLNDVTARDLQRADDQWTRAKGFDSFCPLGPVAPADMDPETLEVRTRVNGVRRQHGRAADMVHALPELVAYVSSIMTLEPDDVIATGTPEGVGPLSPGDVVEVEVSGVGVLRNPVVADARDA